MSAPTLIDLFAGAGGMTAGFSEQGFDPVLAVDWELPAAATYAANYGMDHIRWADIAKLGAGEIPTADVVIGGPPCQGFSNLGTKDPDDPRNALWLEYMRIVLAADPQVFVIENVDRFSKSKEFALLMDQMRTGLLKRWSRFDTGVLNAADYGVPQRRRRSILVASRVGPVSLPAPTHSQKWELGKEPWVGVREAIGHVPWFPDTTQLPDAVVECFGQRVPGIFKSGEIHVGRRPRPISLQRYDHVPPGGGRFDLPRHLLPPCWANKPTGTTDVMGRMMWERPSLTIRTEFFKPEKGQYLHPQWDPENPENRVNRPITHREAALIQTFPPDYLWCGSKIDIARQIGNAVPVKLASAIAASVLERLS